MFDLRRSLMICACSAAFVMGGCGDKDKTAGEEITALGSGVVAALDLPETNASDLDRHFEIKPRKADEADVLAALKLAGIDQGSGANFSYGERVIDGSTVRFSDWAVVDGESKVNAKSVVLYGLHTMDEAAHFDRIDVMDLTAVGVDDEEKERADMTAKELVVAGPSAELAERLLDMLTGREAPDDSALGDLDDVTTLQGLLARDISINASDPFSTVDIGLETLIIGNDEGDGRADIFVDKLAFDGASDSGGPVTFRLASLSAIGVDTSDAAEANNAGMSGLLSLGSQTSAAPVKQLSMGAISFDSAAFQLSGEGLKIDGKNSREWTSVLEPLTFKLQDFTGTPLSAQAELIRAQGLDEITLRGSQVTRVDPGADRMEVSDGVLVIDEGLKMQYSSKRTGLQAARKAMKAAEAKAPNPANLNTEADLEAYLEANREYNAALAAAQANIRYESANIVVQDLADNSLIDRGMTVAAGVTGQPKDRVRAGAKAFVTIGSLTAGTETERALLSEVGSALVDFLDKPGQTLTITMNPPEPISIGGVTDPQDLRKLDPDALGLKASVK